MIELAIQKHLNTSEGKMLLDINLIIEKGKLTTIYGESGVGKTSILRIIAGLLKPDKGDILVNGNLWQSTEKSIYLKPQQRQIGYVFQEYALFPNMSVKENLEFALDKGQNKSIISELIHVIELESLQNHYPNMLSGGQKQRVALARALVRKPDVLLLDEPLSALDINMRHKLQDYILKVHKQYGLTTILVSHDIGEIVKMSDQMVVLKNGKITKQGDPTSLFSNKQLSGKFQFTGEVVKVEKEDVIFLVTVLIGVNLVKIVADEQEAQQLSIGDKILVASKAFNPVIQKII